MNCKECNKEIDGKYGSGQYCDKECAKNGRTKKITEIQLAKGKKDRQYKCEKCTEDFVLKYTIKTGRKIHCEKCKRKAPHTKDLNDIRSIWQLSSRTISKILKRAEIKCSMCGWDKTSLDLHHINERKNGGNDEIDNLIPLCPNCHRLAHEGGYTKEELKLKTVMYVFPNWKDYYNINDE